MRPIMVVVVEEEEEVVQEVVLVVVVAVVEECDFFRVGLVGGTPILLLLFGRMLLREDSVVDGYGLTFL